MPREPEGRLELQINEHVLTGEKRRGKWLFSCPSWPSLETQFNGDTSTVGILNEFVKRALRGAVKISEMTKNL